MGAVPVLSTIVVYKGTMSVFTWLNCTGMWKKKKVVGKYVQYVCRLTDRDDEHQILAGDYFTFKDEKKEMGFKDQWQVLQ